MGVTSHLFACAPSEIALVQSNELDGDDFQGTQRMNGLTSLHLQIVWAEIDGVEWDPDIHMGTPLSEGEPWIEQMPPAMIAAFVSLTDAEAARIAAALAPTEDFGWEVSDVLALIRNVRTFVTAAKDQCICIETAT